MKIFELHLNRLPNHLDYRDGFVIRARNETQARKLASGSCGGEGAEVWLNCEKSVCETILTKDVKAGIILSSFNAG